MCKMFAFFSFINLLCNQIMICNIQNEYNNSSLYNIQQNELVFVKLLKVFNTTNNPGVSQSIGNKREQPDGNISQ